MRTTRMTIAVWSKLVPYVSLVKCLFLLRFFLIAYDMTMDIGDRSDN